MTVKLGHIKRIIQRSINILLKPHWIVLVSFSASAFCWLIPDGVGLYQGYEEAQPLSIMALVFILAWYFFIILLSFFGFHLGQRFPVIREFNRFVPLHQSTVYYFYSLVAWIGIFYTIYVTLSVLGVSGFILSVVQFSTNRIAHAIYEDYAVGIFSLRYVIVLSFGWALYRVVSRGKVHWTDALNIALFVLYIAFFGRRLQLICSILVFLTLINRTGDLFENISFKRLTLFGLIGFALLSVATLLRNYSGYAEMGYENPLVAVLTNIVSYLAAPFQASLGVGNHVLDAFSGDDYRQYTDIDTSLTANSAFADMATTEGPIAIVKVMGWAFGFGYVGGWLYKNRHNYLYTGYPIVLYAFAELWRIDLFTKGIFFTLLIIATAIPIGYTLGKYVLPSRSKMLRKPG